MSSKNNSLVLQAAEGEIMPEEMTYQAKLRTAMFDGVTEQDVTDVVKSIVEKAKAGDAKSQQVFFDYIVGAKCKPTSVTVNNHFATVEQAARIRKAE